MIASARLGEEPLIAYASNITTTGFEINMLSHCDCPLSGGASVQWVAFLSTGTVSRVSAASQILIQRLPYAEYYYAGTLTFPTAFSASPSVVTNGHSIGLDLQPYITSPQIIAPSQVTPVFIDHAGTNTITQAWLQIIAVGTGTSPANLVFQTGSGSYVDGQRVALPATLDGVPTIVVNAIGGTKPVIASARYNGASEFTISLWDYNGHPVAPGNPEGVTSAQIQWIAVGIKN